MDYSVFDGWKSISAPQISRKGGLISYEINPQQGDGTLFLYQASNKKHLVQIARGKASQLSADGRFAVFRITPPYEMVRKKTLEKVKKDKMPRDSVGIYYDGIEKRYANIKSFAVPSKGGNWVAIHFEAEKTNKKDSSNVKKKFKSEGTPLIFLRPGTCDSIRVNYVTQWGVAQRGNSAFMVQSVGDSLENSILLRMNAVTFKVDTLMKRKGKIIQLSVSELGDQCAFLLSADTVKNKSYTLCHYNAKRKSVIEVLPVQNKVFANEWCASENGKVWFSENGQRFFFGVAPKPEQEKKDTITEDEKYHVDVWGWQDADIQPRQKANLKKERERTWTVCYDVALGNIIPLADDSIRRIQTIEKGNASFALGYNDLPYRREADYVGNTASDIYLVDVTTGNKKLLLKKQSSFNALSPTGSHLVWFSDADTTWHVLNVNTMDDVVCTKTSGGGFYDVKYDMPSVPNPYGMAGFTTDGRGVLLYDQYDVWQYDLNGKKAPQRLTNGTLHKIRHRLLRLNDEETRFDFSKTQYLTLFSEKDKRSGLAQMIKNQVKTVMMGDYELLDPIKAKESDFFIVRRSTFHQYPEMELVDGAFTRFTIISDTNPQQMNYLWGDIRQVEWTTPQGKTLSGLLVTPEGMDIKEKYPMLVYFYERSADNLHQHITPRPSRSIINWAYCASNGYVVFIPDITYNTGTPGADAYDAIVSGCQSMTGQFPFIDSTRMALQGQSWGGYQTAWLITRTNMFRCAMAGAPVSNMTSAYGGIRWQTGMSRQFQYEHTQSRIGASLWDNMEGYIENSPLFFAPKVQTPLLMMHNDNDGAVPWYQGVEYFMALRRLNKPVWMLVYNNEEHNLVRRANTKDLTIRMMQFFDHYLKGAPMPPWMSQGVPATDKGKKTGYGF